MVAAVETMAHFGEMPWHENSKPAIGAARKDAVKFVEECGCDWTVSLRGLAAFDGAQLLEVDTHRAIVRDKDSTILGLCGSEYEPLQNTDAFKWFQPFVDADLAEFHTGGSLFGGKRIWALAKIIAPSIEIIPGDNVEKFILLTNVHDYSGAIVPGYTPIRVVCANTMQMALRCKQSVLKRVRHDAKMMMNLTKIRETMNVINQTFEDNAKYLQLLTQKTCSKDQLDEYTRQTFELREDVNSSIVFEVTKLFENGRGTDIDGVRGTWWGAYNAVTEYLAYNACRTSEARLNSLWYGRGTAFNQKALELALANVA